MRGRLPKPLAIRKFENITKPSEMPKDVPFSRPLQMYEYPVELSVAQKLVWDSIAPELIRIKVLALADVPAFIRYINLSIEYKKAEQKIEEHGLVVATRTTVKVSPYVQLRNSLAMQLLKYEEQFGMTPCSRNRVKGVPTGEEGDDGDLLA